MKLYKVLNELIGAPIGFYSLPYRQLSGSEGYYGSVNAPFMPPHTTANLAYRTAKYKKKNKKKTERKK